MTTRANFLTTRFLKLSRACAHFKTCDCLGSSNITGNISSSVSLFNATRHSTNNLVGASASVEFEDDS